MTMILSMSNSDIIRATKNTTYSPIHILVSRHFKEDIRNIEIDYKNIIIWNDEVEEYISYKYDEEHCDIVYSFLDDWWDYIEYNKDEFNADPISFKIERVK